MVWGHHRPPAPEGPPLPGREKSGLIITHTVSSWIYVNADKGYILLEGRLLCSGNPGTSSRDIKQFGYEECTRCRKIRERAEASRGKKAAFGRDLNLGDFSRQGGAWEYDPDYGSFPRKSAAASSPRDRTHRR